MHIIIIYIIIIDIKIVLYIYIYLRTHVSHIYLIYIPYNIHRHCGDRLSSASSWTAASHCAAWPCTIPWRPGAPGAGKAKPNKDMDRNQKTIEKQKRKSTLVGGFNPSEKY